MVRGVKPKSAALHVVNGTYEPGRHAARAEHEPEATGGLVKPKHLKGRASKIWDETARLLTWLAESDSAALALWCGLEAEVRAGIGDMTASRISQWRALAHELGLTPSGRARIGSERAKAKDDADKYF